MASKDLGNENAHLREQIRVLVGKCQEFLYAMKNVQKAAYKKEDVESVKGEFGRAKKELMAEISHLKREHERDAMAYAPHAQPMSARNLTANIPQLQQEPASKLAAEITEAETRAASFRASAAADPGAVAKLEELL